MKKAFVIIALVAVIGFAVWYFFLKKSAPANTTSTVSPNPGSGTIAPGTDVTVPSSALGGGGTVQSDPTAAVDVSHQGEVITITPVSAAIAPDLVDLRNKQWSTEIYKGRISQSDMSNFNYLTSFMPVSNELALMGYNSDAAFDASACTTSSQCEIISISPQSYPFKITYGYSGTLASYVSPDYKTIVFVDGTNVIKIVKQSDGKVIIQGESVETRQVPLLSDLQNLSYNSDLYTASAYRFTGDYYYWIKDFNPLYGTGAGLKISVNNDPDVSALICSGKSGNIQDCSKEPINKNDFPYIISYPNLMRSNGLPIEMAYVSANLRTIYFGKYIGADGASYFRVYKKLTR